MAFEITMPKLSDTMTEGVFAIWKKNVGDHIERGDVIAEVETDKAVMELEAFASGTLLRVMVHGGEVVKVGTLLGLIGSAEEFAAAAAEPLPVTDGATGTATRVEPSMTTVQMPLQPAEDNAGSSLIRTSPLVRRLAREQHIDLGQVSGSGAAGRITEHDLAVYSGEGQNPDGAGERHSAGSELTVSPVAGPAPLSAVRQAVAATVSRSWQTIPHFSVTVMIAMEGCRAVVNDLKGGLNQIGYNSLVIKACIDVLQNYPLLRTIDPLAPNDINISFAVSVADGVMMPVIRQGQKLSVSGIEVEVSRLADKCRAGRLGADEMSGGSFSISNLGMYGVEEFTALIMPGQVATLAVGAVHERPIARNGELKVAPTMHVTLCSDHRFVDGAYAATFLHDLQELLEKPSSLLIHRGTLDY